MDENVKLIGENSLRMLTGVSLEGWLLLGLSAILIGMYAYFHSQQHLDRAVSKRTIRARHREVIDKGSQAITEAFEAATKKGDITKEERDFLYGMIKKGCPKIKELGTEPSFGKPWYYGPVASENAAKVKAAITGRLLSAGMSMKDIISKKNAIRFPWPKKKAASNDIAELVASIKRKA